MPAIPTNEPFELRAGLTWAWRREDLTADYSAANGWALKYWFKKTGAAGANFSIDAVASGAAFAVSVAVSTTVTYTAGDYTWSAVVTKAGESYEVDSGTLKVLPRYDVAANLDDRSHARKVFEAIEAVIEGRATKDQEEYTIGNRSLKRTSIADLLVLRDRYKAEAESEAAASGIANGMPNPRYFRARFDRA
jgi:hypothetical protein